LARLEIARENPAIKLAAEPKLREALAGLGHPASATPVASIWIVTARA